MSTEESQFWMEIREALLALVDIVERRLEESGVIQLRTSQVRKQYKLLQRAKQQGDPPA